MLMLHSNYHNHEQTLLLTKLSYFDMICIKSNCQMDAKLTFPLFFFSYEL